MDNATFDRTCSRCTYHILANFHTKAPCPITAVLGYDHGLQIHYQLLKLYLVQGLNHFLTASGTYVLLHKSRLQLCIMEGPKPVKDSNSLLIMLKTQLQH